MWWLPLVICLAGAAGCAGDDDAETSSSPSTTAGSTSTSQAPVEPLAGEISRDPGAGQARIALGSSLDATLEITDCEHTPDAQPDGQVPAELLVVAASGTTTEAAPVRLDVRRFASEGAAATITDTVTVTVGDPENPDQALVAQRFEVDGAVTDPRDPDADDPLLRISEDRVEAAGVFAPPGAFADDLGLVEGIFVAVCS